MNIGAPHAVLRSPHIMWTCGKCGETVEDSFNACWSCGTTREGVEDPTFQRVKDGTGSREDQALALEREGQVSAPGRENPLACPRCDRALQYVGRKRFHEGTNWGLFGEIGELFVKREHFDVYVCPRCGRVEFFVDGIGEQYRPA